MFRDSNDGNKRYIASNKKKEQEIIEKQLEEEIQKNIDTLLSQMTADTSLEQKLYSLKKLTCSSQKRTIERRLY